MAHGQQLNKLGKFLSYVLGRKPDEFGLIPDAKGYVKIKDLLKALSEEEGWRHIRRGAIDEICITLIPAPVEIRDPLIRATVRDALPKRIPAQTLPKLLHTCIRQRAHYHVVNRGIYPAGTDPVVLSPLPEMAERLGKRIDSQPVPITVNVRAAAENGVVFEQIGDLFLADFIPAGSFTAPPLPREKAEAKTRPAVREKQADVMPGSYFMDLAKETRGKKPSTKKERKAKQPWKKDRKQQRRQKEKMWPS